MLQVVAPGCRPCRILVDLQADLALRERQHLVSGLPDNAAPITVIHSDRTWFGLFEAHHPAAGPTVLFDRSLPLGRSTDLERWETMELAPEPWGMTPSSSLSPTPPGWRWAVIGWSLPAELSRKAAVWSGPVTGPLSLAYRDRAAQVAIDPRWDGEQFTALVPGFDSELGSPASLITPPAGASIYVGGRYRPMAEVNARLEDPNAWIQAANGPGGAAIVIEGDTLYTTADGAAWERRRLAEQIPSSLLSDDPEVIRNTTIEAPNLIVGETYVVMEIQLLLRDGDQVEIVERGWFRLPIPG